MERSDHPRVVVVGGGIIGSAIAMHLAERGLRPLLVDEDRAGEAASARSFASLSAFGNDPVAYYELACAALASWSRWAKRLGEVGYRRGGELRWAADPQQGRELAEQVERARSRGYPIVPVDETDLRQLLPAAEPGPVVAACRAATQATGCCGRPSPCWPPGPSRSRSPAPSASTSPPWPALACWSRPSRCPPSPTRWSTCPAAPGRRCTCGSGRTARSCSASAPRKWSPTTPVSGTPGPCSTRPPASCPSSTAPGSPAPCWPGGRCPPTGSRSSVGCPAWTASTWP